MTSEASTGTSPPFQRLDETVAPPPKDPRKKRLFLGYSAEQLRSTLNLESRLEQKKNASKNALSKESTNGDEPENYENLDEVTAPEPVDRKEERPQGYLEQRSGGKGEKEYLNGASRIATEIYTISHLIFFSIFGTLARLGLQALTFYPGAPVQTGVLWANVGGSLLMGFLSEDRNLFKQEWGATIDKLPVHGNDVEKGTNGQRSPSQDKHHGAIKKTLPMYIGLATGFCGSFTSFSSFIRDTFYALSNALPVPIQHPSSAAISQTINVPRNGGYSFLAILAVLITTIGLSLGGLQIGAQLAIGLDHYTPSIPFLLSRRIIDRCVVFLAAGCWLAAIFMSIFPPDQPGGRPSANATGAQETWRSQALFALVFAPLGCILRFYISLFLNPRIKSFPLGTFTVNILGTAMEAMFIDLQRSPATGGMVGCQVLQGMQDGFCGCLTTVSTWVIELKGLRTRHAYLYGGVSVAVGLAAFIIISGSLLWTQGFAPTMCVT